MSLKIDLPEDKIKEFCQRHRIRNLSLFGSVLREDFGPESDIDVLIEFETGAHVGLITLAGMEIELSQILGHKVEIHTAKGLSPYFRDRSSFRESKFYII